MEECVNVYKKQREDLLKLARSIADEARSRATDATAVEGRPSKKRRIQQSNGVDGTSVMPTRSTRSQSRVALQASQESLERLVVDDSGDDGSQYAEEDSGPPPSLNLPSEPADGLVECPMCSKRMKEESVFLHLDQCDGTDQSSPKSKNPAAKRKDPTAKQNEAISVAYSLPSTNKARQRLGALNYSLLSETALRKKLAEIGIPSYGSKPLMQRRHMEWMNLWNASCDSSNPMTKKQLLRELDIWERTQGRQIANTQGPSGVMAKDFDAEAWTRSNKDDFAELITRARAKAQKTVPVQTKTKRVEESPRPSQDLKPTLQHDRSSVRNGVIDLTSPVKAPLEQQQDSQSSQMNRVSA